MDKLSLYRVESARPPVLEITDWGIYVRFIEGAEVAKTVVRREWPHVAVDFDREERLIGIEAIPMPEEFSLGRIARQAGVSLPTSLSAGHLRIRQVKVECMLARCANASPKLP